jgi:hypothetical protein
MKLNQRQRKIVQLGAALILVTLLYPPFHFSPPGGGSIGLGHAFLLTPPESRAVVNVAQLCATWFGIVLSLGLWVWLSNDWRPTETTSQHDRISPLQAIRIGAAKTGYLGLALLGVVLFSVYRANDAYEAALKLFGNGGAALLIYIGALVWTSINGYRGKYASETGGKTNWRVLIVAGTVVILALSAIGWMVQSKESAISAERDLLLENRFKPD